MNSMHTIKHTIFSILALCLWASAAQAQLAFESDTWDFGTVREDGGRVSHTFTGVNRSDKPMVILDVVATCGCTVPEFSRQPVLPGQQTKITVTFDPMHRPGTTSKELGVYSSDRKKIATLTVRGNVSPRPLSIEERYPTDAGGGLRLSSTLCAFSYLYPGQQMQSSIGYANTSNRTIFLTLAPQQTSGLLTLTAPQKIAPGEQGEINISYLVPAAKPRYGTVRDILEINVDGRANGTQLMVHGIGVDNPVKDPEKAPKSDMSENILKFGAVKHTGPVQRRKFTLSNSGSGDLIVRAVEHEGRITTNLKPGLTIPAGGSFAIEVTLDPRKLDFGVTTEHLVLITNDPARPMRRLRVTAIVEQ